MQQVNMLHSFNPSSNAGLQTPFTNLPKIEMVVRIAMCLRVLRDALVSQVELYYCKREGYG